MTTILFLVIAILGAILFDTRKRLSELERQIRPDDRLDSDENPVIMRAVEPLSSLMRRDPHG